MSQTQVESRGSVRIKSADPRLPPAIRYNYLATEHDRRTMVEGMRLLRRIPDEFHALDDAALQRLDKLVQQQVEPMRTTITSGTPHSRARRALALM